MVRNFLLIITFVCSFSAHSQEKIVSDSLPQKTLSKPEEINKRGKEDTSIVRNKKGRVILPQAGDIAIGFNMVPIIDLFFGAVNFNTPYPGAANVVQYTQNSNNQLVGKYFIDAKSAIRIRFGVNTLAGSITNKVQDAEAMYKATLGTKDDIAAASLIKVDDKVQFTKSNILITVGYEKRRGYRRLQGFYGAEVGFGRNGSIENYSYGNGFSDVYNVEYTSDFNTLNTSIQSPTTSLRVERTTKVKNENGFRYGLRGFIGIEYFIFTKISIGAEYGWGFAFVTQGPRKLEREVYFNGQNGPEVITEEVNTDNSGRQSGFSVDNNNGSIFSMNNTLGGNTLLSGGAGALTLLFHF